MNKLAKLIKSKIRDRGPITFAEFMELALYEPQLGYYCSGKSNIGKEGDFYTSTNVHEAFGSVLANFIVKSLELIDSDKLAIVELGSAKGLLAKDILNYIKARCPDLYHKITYYIIEINRSATDDPQNLLIDRNDKIKIFTALDQIENSGLSGVVISNEFFDALPFHRLKIQNGNLMEIYVSLENGDFTEILETPGNQDLTEYYNRLEAEMTEGQEFEINLCTQAVIVDINKMLSNGIILTIDYGYLSEELYDSSRMKGTYKCLYQHTVNENPFKNIGNQDITAHVDFSNLISIGKSQGLNKLKYTTQGQFLIDWGLIEILEMSGEKDIQSIKNLFLPELMGDRFKVLVQEKNMGDKMIGFFPESPFKISFKVL